MATIYRFIVEQQQGNGGGGRKSDNATKKNAKDKTFTMLGSRGVEHNRKLRAINPVLNKATGGYWERGMRVGRAGLGLLKFKKTASGGVAFAGISSVAVAIIIAFALQTTMKYHRGILEKSERENKQNFKKLEVGQNAIHGSFQVTKNWWSGKKSYNENK